MELKMTIKEADKYSVIKRIESKKINLKQASKELGLSYRQTRRIWRSYSREGPKSLISKKRERPSNNQLSEKIKYKALFLIKEKYIDYGFILRCDPDELFKRLEKKNFELKKIIENVQTEILGNCVNFFIQKQVKAPLFEIDTTSLSIESVAKIIISIVVEKKDLEKHYIGKVDWIEKLFQENRLEEFFD